MFLSTFETNGGISHGNVLRRHVTILSSFIKPMMLLSDSQAVIKKTKAMKKSPASCSFI